MSFYSELAETATELLAEFGAPGTLARSLTAGPTTYDPETGTTTTPTSLPEPLVAAVFEYDERLIDGSLIQQGDREAYVSVAGLEEPKNTDILVWPVGVTGVTPETFTIIKNKKIAPAGLNVLYILQVRK